MPGREPILSTFTRIDLGWVRQEKVKEAHAITYFQAMSEKAQELDAKLMAEYPKMIELGFVWSERWR